jgi:prolyl-tRNA synthetase
VEKAVSLPLDGEPSPFKTLEKRETPQTETIEKLCQFLNCSATQIVKTVLYQAVYDQGTVVLVLVSIRGDQSVNEVKLQNELAKLAPQYASKTVIGLSVPSAEEQQKWTAQPLPLGYIGPDLADSYLQKNKNLAPEFLRLVDRTAVDLQQFVTGANETNYHRVGASWNKDLPLPKQIVDVRKAVAGDRAVHEPTQTLKTARGIEVGHIFQLGTKYSQALNATYTSEQGEELPLVMGCYGIGVSRLAQSAVEQSHDSDGIIWPVEIAPYHVMISVPNIKDTAQMDAAESLYTALKQAGVETLLDDRDERPGVKFKDADLIGIPYRIVTGKALANGKVEIVQRQGRKAQEIALSEVVSTLQHWIAAALSATTTD